MSDVTNILLSGVGGQGTILASNILAHVFLEAGFDVKKSEIHGMAQRGGDVVTHVRFGDKVYSPLIRYGEVDFLLSFELLEGLRCINWLKRGARVLLNNQVIPPPSVSTGREKYPQDIVATFRKFFRNNFYLVDGRKIAEELGNIQAANVVLVGAFSNFFPRVPEDLWISAIRALLRESLHELNIRAFREGRKALKSY